MGRLHDLLKASGYSGHALELLLVRLLFCLFADDRSMPFQKASMRPRFRCSPARTSLTCFSNMATRRRSMPNTPKKSFQKLCASARSEVSLSHLREKASARDLISFQDSGTSGRQLQHGVAQPLDGGVSRFEYHGVGCKIVRHVVHVNGTLPPVLALAAAVRRLCVDLRISRFTSIIALV